MKKSELKKLIRETIKNNLDEGPLCCRGRRGGCCTCIVQATVYQSSWNIPALGAEYPCCCEGKANKKRCCGSRSSTLRYLDPSEVPVEVRAELER